MELRHLRTFLAVVEAASITAAARQLHIAQPAVTRQIRQLEGSVGTDLFHRTPRGVTPTPAGRLLTPEARRLVGEADALVDSLRNNQTNLGGTLRIGVPEEGLGPLGPIVLAAYQAAHPNIAVIVDDQCELSAVEGLGDRYSDHDVVLWGLSPEDGPLVGTSVYGERFQVAVAASSELGRSTDPAPINDVLDLRFVNLGSLTEGYASHHNLPEFRNGARPRLGREVTHGLDGVLLGLASGDFVACMTPNTAPIPGVALIEIDVETRVDVGVIHRATEQRRHVKNFATIAATIGRELYHLVPGALPPTSTRC